MDPEFDSIYQEQLRAFRALQMGEGSQLDAPARRLALELVEAAVAKAVAPLAPAYDVRADAKLFLQVNLLHMIALPLLLRKPPLPPVEIIQTLENDARRIAEAALNYADDAREISAASMLRGSAAVLPQLRLREWRLWDRRR